MEDKMDEKLKIATELRELTDEATRRRRIELEKAEKIENEQRRIAAERKKALEEAKKREDDPRCFIKDILPTIIDLLKVAARSGNDHFEIRDTESVWKRNIYTVLCGKITMDDTLKSKYPLYKEIIGKRSSSHSLFKRGFFGEKPTDEANILMEELRKIGFSVDFNPRTVVNLCVQHGRDLYEGTFQDGKLYSIILHISW